MFDVTGCSGEELAARLVANEADLRERECEVLVLAAAWADVHDLDTTAPAYEPLVERGVGYGGDGCPDISEYAVHELAGLRGTSSGTAEQLVADALDLRHRHPRLWARVRTGEVRAWQAVHVARSCHHLSREAADLVDRAVTGHLGLLPWARFGRVLAAAILQADATTAAERAEQARRSRGVWAYPGEDGLKTLVAKAAAGDVVCLLATVNRVADVLAADGDTTSADERRAKALGLLAQPARVLQLLIAHQHDQHPHSSASAATEDEEEHPEEEEEEEEERQRGGLNLTAPGLTARPADLLPRVVLHFHLSDAALAAGHGVVRPEHDGPTSLQQLRAWLTETRCPVTVRPVTEPPSAAPSTSTTPSPTSHPTADHPARPACTTSDRSPGPTTEPSPTAAGDADNPNPAPTCSAHPTATSSSSPTRAPSSSAAATSPPPSGDAPASSRRSSGPWPRRLLSNAVQDEDVPWCAAART